jgi:hypothetical protein
MNKDLTFETLVSSIRQVHEELAAQTAKAVNISLTLRNWLIGFYIAKFELDGADRANYGEKMLSKLAEHLTKLKVSNCSRRQLYEYLEFYRVYPQIGGTVSAQLQSLLPANFIDEIKVPTASAQLSFSPEKLIKNLSYSKFRLLVDLNDDLKRSFYELECIRGNWSVRELDRQIHSLYFERSGLSKNKEKLSELTNLKAEPQEAKFAIRDPYIFEFLGLKPKEVMDESKECARNNSRNFV